ncbi:MULTISPECIES: type IV secretion system protein [unclassified Sphingomonas]|nr:type IV secretion system protein [Sphingomonas sp. FARSPH]
MTLACVPVDADAGVVLHFAANAECAAQTIGADGFQAMIGGPVAAGLLSALVTIFVAIIGYRLVLGNAPRFDEGIGRVLRLGIVLALVTGWPAFQTLVYDTTTQAPEELAATILPAAGLSPTGLPERVQAIYDAMRLGASGDPRAADPQQVASTATTPNQPGGAPGPVTSQQPANGQPGLGALPQTASLFAVATIGTLAALHLALGILLALAPLAILALLFDGTLGLFNGWMRALVGVALGGLAATIVTAVMLIPIEQEVLRLQGWRGGGVLAVVDTQALPTLVLACAMAMLVGVLAAVRMGSALRYAPGTAGSWSSVARHNNRSDIAVSATTQGAPGNTRSIAIPGRDRAAGVAEALATTVRREQRSGGPAVPSEAGARGALIRNGQQDRQASVAGGQGPAARRTTLRRSRVAASRDKVGQ